MRPNPLVLLACLPLSLGSSAAQTSEAAPPPFDYTNLRDSDEAYWEDLMGTSVSMQDALTVALASFETGEARARLARFVREEPAHYAFEVFHFDEGGTRRFDVLVSASEPKVTGKKDLGAVQAEALQKADVLMQAVINGVTSKLGEEGGDARVNRVAFSGAGKPSFQVEAFHFDTEASLPRRYEIQFSGVKPKIIRKFLVDRFPGEPLRRAKPVELPSGLLVHDFVVGDGPELTKSSKVRVNYRLWLLDNTKLKDTWKSKSPEVFLVETAPLPGMTEGMLGMRVGGRRKIAMPYSMGYGESRQGRVPEKAMIVVDVEIVAIEE